MVLGSFYVPLHTAEAAGAGAHEPLARLIVEEDEDRERYAREPVGEAQGARSEEAADGGDVAEEGAENGLKDEAGSD